MLTLYVLFEQFKKKMSGCKSFGYTKESMVQRAKDTCKTKQNKIKPVNY